MFHISIYLEIISVIGVITTLYWNMIHITKYYKKLTTSLLNLFCVATYFTLLD